MRSDFLSVLEFHKKFDLPLNSKPVPMDDEAGAFRIGFLREEAVEYEEAYREGNLVGMVDALIDFVYVACGTGLFIGCPRTGVLGQWPTYMDIREWAYKQHLFTTYDVPHILSPGLYAFVRSGLDTNVNLFVLAHEAAVKEEPAALELSLYLLKQCCAVAYLAAAMMQVPWERCFACVQRANMSKVRADPNGSNSKRLSRYDVVKPKTWVAPDARIMMELELFGWKAPEKMRADIVTGRVEMDLTEGGTNA